MLKIVNRLETKATRREDTSLIEHRVRGADGKVEVVRSLDPNSRTLAADIHYLFTKNVAKARRDNKRLTGRADGVPPRS